MKYLGILLLLLFALSGKAFGTTVTIAANSVPNFNATNLGSDKTLNVSVTSGSPTVTTSSTFPAQSVGMGGFTILLSGVEYTVAYVTSTTSLTLTTNYASGTATVSCVFYKWVWLQIYSNQDYRPAGASYIVTQGAVGSQNWYKKVGCSVVNTAGVNYLRVPELSVDATTDALPTTARLFFWLYRIDTSAISSLACASGGWAIPPNTPTGYVTLCSYNSPLVPPPPNYNTYSQAEIDAFLPTCSANQMIYFAATGRPQACLTVGTGLAIVGGSLNSTGISTAYSTIQEEGSGLTQRSTLNFAGSGLTAADDTTRTTVTVASPLNALASNSTAGLWAPTGAVTGNARTITGTGTNITVADGNGAAGNPTINIGSNVVTLNDIQTLTNKTLTTPTITNPTLTANLRQAINVKNYGCVGDDVTDDTTCITNAYTAAVAAGGFYLYFPTGTYLFDGLSITASNLIIVGDGPGHSILHSRTNAAAVITVNNTAAARNNITIRDLELKGFGSGANNHGLALTGVTARNSLTVQNVKISTVGGSNILSSGGALSNSSFSGLDLDSPSSAVGHTIDIVGTGNNQMSRVIVHNVPDNLTAFRLRGVNWLFDSVSAQDTGSTGTGWGIIGEDVANDGQSTPTFLDCRGCIVQLWSGADAVDFRANSYGSFRYSTVSTASSGLNKRAFRFRGVTSGQTGIFDAESKIALNGTATWANSLPVHSVEAPFLEVGSEEISSYYDTSLTTSIAMAGVRQVRVDSSRAGVSIKNLALGTSSGQGMISHLRFAIDNTYDIGTASSGQRPANIYVSSTGFFNNAIQVGSPSASTGEARLYNSSNSNAVRLGAPAGASDYAFTFPSSLPTAGNEFLQISNVGAVTSNLAPWQNKGTDYTPDITVANTTTETSLMGTADVGSFTVSANTARVGQMFKITMGGTIGGLATGALTGNITLKWKLGGTTIASSGAIAINQDGTGATWKYEGYAVITALGASGSITAYQGTFSYNSTNGGTAISFGTAKTTSTIDTTTSLAFDTSAQFSVADAKNTITRTWSQIDQSR